MPIPTILNPKINLIQPLRRSLKKTRLFFGIPFLLICLGCIHLISHYDPVTYKGLTDVKAETALFLENVSGDKPYSEYAANFADLQLQVEKIYEYEKGKKLNADTLAQISEIRAMIQDMMNLYKEKNKLSVLYLQEKKKQLETAFDLAIATEDSKSR